MTKLSKAQLRLLEKLETLPDDKKRYGLLCRGADKTTAKLLVRMGYAEVISENGAGTRVIRRGRSLDP